MQSKRLKSLNTFPAAFHMQIPYIPSVRILRTHQYCKPLDEFLNFLQEVIEETKRDIIFKMTSLPEGFQEHSVAKP
jgi:hypothetical protein